eukprot:8962192-Lingulodinium_polyedra.AAC.1
MSRWRRAWWAWRRSHGETLTVADAFQGIHAALLEACCAGATRRWGMLAAAGARATEAGRPP